MSALLPDFLRAAVSTVMESVLMVTLLKPKYGKKVTTLAMLGITLANFFVAAFCYLNGNLTLLSKLDVFLFTVLCFAIRPLFQDSFMQWLFSYITLQIINAAVVALSFLGSRRLPYPAYANTVLRLALFLAMVFLLRRYVRPLYRQMAERWNIFFYVAAAIYAAFLYYFVGSDDVVATLTENAVPLLLLIVVTVAVYVSICFSLRTISREYDLREENMRMQNNHELLHLSASAMADRIRLLDDAQQQSRIAAHDRRHFNNTLLGLLEQRKTEEAVAFLRQQSGAEPVRFKNYCENTVINAAVCYYAGLAEDSGITIEISLDIPNSLPVDSLELAMVLSNLMENSIHACEALEKDRERTIRFTCRHVGRLVLEISNPCSASAVLDENGLPVAKESGHGTGTKSVLAFAEGHGAEVMYQIADGIFRVRMLI